jgi:subtilisin family serine protease
VARLLRLRVLVVLLALGASAVPAVPALGDVSDDRTSAAAASPASTVPAGATDRLIVRLRPDRGARQALDRVEQLSGRAAVLDGHLGAGYRQVALDGEIDLELAEEVAGRLRREGRVDEAGADRRVQVATAPNDPLYDEQWHLHGRYRSSSAYGIDVEDAWAVSKGDPDVVVAVLDTGVLDHPDLVDRLVSGYDFVDGDDDASDPGDACGDGADAVPSSWHGTHVAGTIGASTDNGVGVAGVDQRARLQPVRVLGACSGYESDIVRGIRWATGHPVQGVPDNATPARVLNLSLGGDGACSPVMQAAVEDARAAGATVVAAAGNHDGSAQEVFPANCDGVLTVAATSRVGDRAWYSNVGEVVDIAAPGGDTRYGSPSAAVLSLTNTGTTDPDPDGMTYGWQQGTSMAAPHVAGTVSLLLSVLPLLTPDEVRTLLQETATPFPASSPNGSDYVCSDDPGDPYHCGAGIVSAGGVLGIAPDALDDLLDPEPTEPSDPDDSPNDPPDVEPDPAPEDDQLAPPPAPQLRAEGGELQVTVSWDEVEHDRPIEAYELHQSTTATCDRSSELIHRGGGTSHVATDLDGGTTYRYCMVAVDDEERVSDLSEVVEATPTSPPAPPSWASGAELRFDLTSAGDVVLSWPAAKGEVREYEVLRDGRRVATTTRRSATVRDLEVDQRYRLEVRAMNSGGSSPAISRRVTPSGGFPDVASGSPFDLDIRWLATAEITRGCSSDRFCPTDPVTRQQMAAFLRRALTP